MEIDPYATPQASLATESPMPQAGPALWNPNAAGLWSLLLSPVFGSVLLMKNWQAIGDEQQALKARTWLLFSLVSLVIGVFLRWWPLVYIIIWYLNFQRNQTAYVQERWGNGYPRKGWGYLFFWAWRASSRSVVCSPFWVGSRTGRRH